MRRLAPALLLLVALAAGALLARGSEEERPLPARAAVQSEREPAATPPPHRVPAGPETVIVRRRGGLPGGWEAWLRAAEDVGVVARVERGQALLRRASGAGTRRIPAGHVVLADLIAIEPRGYGALLPEADRATFAALRPGTALLSRTSARVRRMRAGGTLTLAGGRRLRVVGVVADELVRAAEVVVHRADAARLDAGRPYLLVAATPAAARRALRLPARPRRGSATVVAGLGAAPWAVTGGIARPARLKARFGEPAVRLPVGEDWITLDRAFTTRNIVSRPVPILGTVTCHRRMIPPLRAALSEVVRRGLSRVVDRSDYAGCFAPRRIPGSGSLSLHAWGLAVDLNASENPLGARPRLDRRLVRIFERHGFTWGGRWPTQPDGMHFEYHGDGPTGPAVSGS